VLGKTISHYKVLEKIGEGGMGVVYRATDTKLNRDVALKILPERFASDSQRMDRFQREAEVLASLDHPNIGQIYGIEDAGQTKALVLQLIEGPTLADKIAQGPIPVEDALKIALQMAEGLEAAHEKGVIHRDLKPANIKITPEDQVKILDFGIPTLGFGTNNVRETTFFKGACRPDQRNQNLCPKQDGPRDTYIVS